MSTTLKSGASSDLQTVDGTSKAGRVTLYDSAGRELSSQKIQTYAACTNVFSPPATPTDMATITGSASKTIRVLAVRVGTTQTTSGANLVGLAKRSTANSGGSSSAITAVPLDSNNSAATATVLSYTANATLGNLVGYISGLKLSSPKVTDTALVGDIGSEMMPQLRSYELEQPVVLRGTGEVLAVNFSLGAGTALPTAYSVIASFVWTEES